MLAVDYHHALPHEMKKLSGNITCMSGCFASISLLLVLPIASAAIDTPMTLSVSAGQRKDDLNWSIAGMTNAGNMVNVLSELKWENLAISQFQVAGEFHLKNDRRLRARVGYGVIGSGTNQDSDYNGNNRTQEYSRSNNKAGGNVFDASVGMGKMLRLRDLSPGKSLYVTPVVGLSLHRQNLTMTNGVQTVPALGPFPGLASSYDAQWMGPWLGAEARVETEQGWSVMANAEYHLAEYSAKANWNLRTEPVTGFAHPVSFRHTATGDGFVLSLGASYPVGNNWKMNFTMEQRKWTTRAGSDQVYRADGTVGYGYLNAVHWDSTAYNLGIERKF